METKPEEHGSGGSYQVMEVETMIQREGGASNECTEDGSMDRHGKPAVKRSTGGWRCAFLILVNQGLVTLAFAGVEVNMVLFSKTVLGQTNAEAANTFSRWMGTVYLFSLFGAFVSDSYLGRYPTCISFQVLFILGLVGLSLSTQLFLLKPDGCGIKEKHCQQHSRLETAMFYVSTYLIALGNGAPEPALAAFGADQFDEEDGKESKSKSSFYSYFYVALNLGSLVAETVLIYAQNIGKWTLSYWVCAASGLLGYIFLLSGTLSYRHFKPSGNPLSRFFQVIFVSIKKIKVPIHDDGEVFYETHRNQGEDHGERKLLHTNDFRYLDRAAIISAEEKLDGNEIRDPWKLCTVTQVEEVKCVLRLMPIWLCTIISSLVYIQMLSLFVEQGAAMNTNINGFHIPPASMTVFDIVTTSAFILLYDEFIVPLYKRVMKAEPKNLSELKRIGIGISIGVVAMVIAGLVEQQRLRYASPTGEETSSLFIFWQIPQYVLVGVSEAFIYVAQMEFFASQIPDGLKSLGIGLSMSSSAIGSYVCSMLLSVVMAITSRDGKPGWVPPNLNHGHLDRFFFLSAGIALLDLGFFIFCAKRFKNISFQKRNTTH